MCQFCKKIEQDSDIIYRNKHVFCVYDAYPVTQGHVLIITKRHIKDFFDASDDEKQSILEAIEQLKKILDSKFRPDGYNIGINNGEAAGQTICHLHIHFIPRYIGDTPSPKGGVRGVIPNKQSY